MKSKQSIDLQCSSLNNLNRYYARDLFKSHANRIGSTKQAVIASACKTYQPRSCPVTPYTTPFPDQNHSKHKSKANEIQKELKWLRTVSSQSYDPPATNSTFSRPSSRYSQYSVNKSVQSQFRTSRNKRYKRPFSSMRYRSKKSKNTKTLSRPQTAKIMLPNKMLLSHRSYVCNQGAETARDPILSAWTLKDKGSKSFVFDPIKTIIIDDDDDNNSNENVNDDESKNNVEFVQNVNEESKEINQQKPMMDVLDINSINDDNVNMKKWRMTKQNHPNSTEIIENNSDDMTTSNNNKTASMYLTNIEREDFETRSILQNSACTDHLYTDRPKSVPCNGLSFRDFEKIKMNLSKSGVIVHRSAIEKALSTPHPIINSQTLSNDEIVQKGKAMIAVPKKYPFPIPGEGLVSMKSHGLQNPNSGSGVGGGKKKKGKKGKKKGGKKKGKKKKSS